MKSFQILTLLLSTSTLLFSAVQAQHFDCSSIMPEEPCMKDPEKCFREWEAASAFPSPPPYVVLKSYSNSLELNITSEERTALTNSLHNINATVRPLPYLMNTPLNTPHLDCTTNTSSPPKKHGTPHPAAACPRPAPPSWNHTRQNTHGTATSTPRNGTRCSVACGSGGRVAGM